MAHTAIILGAGIGGLVAANELRKRSSRKDRIILVDRNPMHLFAPSLLWLAVGKRRALDIQRPVRDLLRSGIEFVQGNVDSIDPASRTVMVDGRPLSADAIVIALGAELAGEAIPGLIDGGHDFYTLAGAQSLYEAVKVLNGGRVVIMTAGPVYKCPAAPYEAAMLIEDQLRKRGVREKATMEMYAAEPMPMGVAGPAVSDAVKAMLATKGITYSANRQVTSVDPASHTISFADGSSATYDLLAYVPPHRAPKVIASAGLVGDAGWIPVDRSTLKTAFEHVYAVGDATTIPLSVGKPLPKAGVFAHAQAVVVAKNIAGAWRQQPTMAAFDGHGACFLETGDGKAAIGSGNFFGEPRPTIALRPPSLFWHLGKVIVEKRRLKRWPF